MPMPRVTPTRVATAAALLIVAVALGACQAVDSFYPPAAVTQQGAATRNLYDIVFGLAAVVFVVVELLIVFTVIRYKRKPTDTELPPQIHGNNLVEVIWTVIPTIIVAVLFFLSWQVLNTVDARSAEPQQAYVRATAARFQWTFQYLDKDGKLLFESLAPELTVPAGENVHLTLQSKDVTHSFYVPQFLFKRDVIPGRENWFDFTIDPQDAGQTFRGQCAQLCGTYHSSMIFSVRAVTPAAYAAFIADGTAKAQATPAPSPSASAGGPQAATPIVVTAQNIAFATQAIEAPANTPFTIQFQNQDAGIPHDIVIHKGMNVTDPPIFDGEIFSGVDSRLYPIPALPAGTYLFSCKVHPNMTGTLTVK
jgi:cytochrome c oxidase subunit 2